MSHRRNSNSRTLGHVRPNNEFANGRAPLPPVSNHKIRNADFGNGIIVSSLALPPGKSLPSPTPRRSRSPPFSDGPTKNDQQLVKQCEELRKELQEKDRIIKSKATELKEKIGVIKNQDAEIKSVSEGSESLRSRISQLEEECEKLKLEIKDKQVDIDRLQAQISANQSQVPDKDYKPLYEAELSEHSQTRDLLCVIESKLDAKQSELEKERIEQNNKYKLLRKQMDDSLSELTKQKNLEIAEREDRIKKLKKQIADQFTGNSWERQQQIDELTKELNKIQGECDTLRHKIKLAANGKSCPNCSQLQIKLDQSQKVVKEKERAADELSLVCGRLEAQLKQQEELIKQWQGVKGRVLVFEK